MKEGSTASSQAAGHDDVSKPENGVLLHDTAEIMADTGRTEHEEWHTISERLAGEHRAEAALDEAKACIDPYLEFELCDRPIVDAEQEFELDVDGHELVWFIDAVYRRPNGELVVVV